MERGPYCPWPIGTCVEEEYEMRFEEFLFKHAQKELIKILLKDDPTKHYSVAIK